MLPAMSGVKRGWVRRGATAALTALTGVLVLGARTVSGLPDPGARAAILHMLEQQERFLVGAGRLQHPVLGDSRPGHPRLQATIRALIALYRSDLDEVAIARALATRFERVTLAPDILLTGYHLPVLEVRDRPDAEFRHPLYRRPPDLIEVDLGQFRPELQGQSLAGRLRDGRLLPYPERQAIEDHGALAGQGLELAWARDELDLYLLQVQGSGYLRDASGRERLARFAGTNGRPYRSLGKMLVEDGLIPADQVSVPAIRETLARPGVDRHAYLGRNERFVFFEVAQGPVTGSGNMPLTPGHSIAADRRVMSPGFVALLSFVRPVPDASGSPMPGERETRLVGIQDTGAAIVGPGRADLFLGGGEPAAWLAGQLKASASLEFLLLRPEGEVSR